MKPCIHIQTRGEKSMGFIIYKHYCSKYSEYINIEQCNHCRHYIQQR